MFTSILLIAIATYLIWRVSESFDAAATYLTRNLNEGIKGPTVNAIASSLPELLISLFFLFYIGNIQGFSAGFATIIGSSIFNIAMIPTIAFLFIFYKQGISEFPTNKKIIQQDGIFLIITELVLLVALYFGGVSITLASILILLYIFYICHVIYTRSKGKKVTIQEKEDHLEENSSSLLKSFLYLDFRNLFFRNKELTTFKAVTILIVSVIILSVACKQLVDSSEHLSVIFNINLFFVTFFITAIASSIPDTILSVKDATNRKYKDSFSNAYASNIFDICIGIGLPVLVYLIINGVNEISTESSAQFSSIIFTSSILLLVFTSVITFIYWLKDINLIRTILIIVLYIIFLSTIYYIS
jgi:cation:H+ antiporter